MAGFEGLPQYTDGRALRRPKRRFRQGRVLVTGAAGAIGTVVANHLGDEFRLVGLDVRNVGIVREELAATEAFRIRYGTSGLRGPVWSDEPYSWSPEGAA